MRRGGPVRRELPPRRGVQVYMQTGAEQNCAINVTPLIDVLLVLLIIFLVITPVTSTGLPALAPETATAAAPEQPDALVVSIGADGAIRVNRRPVTLSELPGVLREAFAVRPATVLFVHGSPELAFGDVAAVIDIGRGAGWERIGLMPAGAP
ncbi:MAG: biopolymer transporter ExbD [Bryobacteraceae bacterium]|nr:biopolymer transporter ExbD [Bryobacteraceae bacterium]